jgi:hypothetical protein
MTTYTLTCTCGHMMTYNTRQAAVMSGALHVKREVESCQSLNDEFPHETSVAPTPMGLLVIKCNDCREVLGQYDIPAGPYSVPDEGIKARKTHEAKHKRKGTPGTIVEEAYSPAELKARQIKTQREHVEWNAKWHSDQIASVREQVQRNVADFTRRLTEETDRALARHAAGQGDLSDLVQSVQHAILWGVSNVSMDTWVSRVKEIHKEGQALQGQRRELERLEA